MYCFSLCVTVFFTALLLFTVRCFVTLLNLLFILSLLFDTHTVVFTLYAHGGFFTRSVVTSQMYITTVCVSFCVAGKVGVGQCLSLRWSGIGWNGGYVKFII